MTSIEDLLREWVPQQRWFGGKGRGIASLATRSCGTLSGGEEGATLEVLLVDIGYHDGHSERYQVPLSTHPRPVEGLDGAWLGELDGVGHLYDGTQDPAAAALLLRALSGGDQAGTVRFRALLDVPAEARSRALGAEQSNTSVVYGDELVLKLFRKVSPGINPDLELTRALQEAGSPHIAPVHAYVETDQEGEPTTLGVAQRFLAGASEGWAMATASVRDLYALHEELGRTPDPGEAGGDFAAEAERLGSATAEVHRALAEALESGTAGAEESRRTAERMLQRLDEALEVVPELRPHGDALRGAFEALGGRTRPVPVQRVHGDFHLGQVLRTPEGWVLLDFEGEPARPLAERRLPMSPLRDVAGMLRSFDYAARFLLAERGSDDGTLAGIGTQWSERNRSAFCDGYAAAAGADPREEADLLRAFELDKAVYEVLYEARNRPTWLPIPLDSVARLVGGQQ